jgi:hypothetical protein
MAEKKGPNPLLGILGVAVGAGIGYWWKGTFNALWIGGLISFLLVGLIWAFLAVLLNRDRDRWK